ncbi:unnamed protein product [Symbiodinium sp. KB8]|nr:unnamed protein product [Symbiodinium sp. KB8]
MTPSAAIDSTTLQRQKDAEAELALLECWGESPPQTLPMDTEPSAGEKRATSPEQERRKYHRRDSKGSGAGKGSGDRPARQMPRPPPRTRRAAAEPNETNTEGMMWMMGRMLLRLEDQMAMERFQSGFAQKDMELSLALRAFLFRSMFDIIQKRLQETVKNPTQLEAAQQLQVFLPDKEGMPLRVPYLMYNTETRQLEPKASFELYDNLILLTNSGLWQLVGGSLRTERMSRNPLAVELQKRLQKQHER